MPESFQEIQQAIEDFQVYDDDVWITSFPKCGTTWSQELVWCVLHDLNLETTKEETDLRMPFIEFCCILCPQTFKHSGSRYDPGYLEKSVELARDAKRPRILKTHLPFELLPKQIQTFERKPKIVHVYRNMKDTCVSYFHHQRLLEGFRGDFDLFWKLFITGKLNYTPMTDNILSYWKHRNRDNILFIRFEDMKANIRSVIASVCEFFNKSFLEKDIEKLLEYLSFDGMKNNPYVDKHRVLEYCKAIGVCSNAEGNFIRQGKTGGHKSDMSKDVEDIFDQHLKSKLIGTGLNL